MKDSRNAWMLVIATLSICLVSARADQVVEQNCSPSSRTSNAAVAELARTVRAASFPELARVEFQITNFHSQNDYFRTRFSLPRFVFLLPMRYSLQVNPRLFKEQPPALGVCAILAHELSHLIELSHGNRIRRLGLVRLVSGGYTTRFERHTDLEAIHRGYGEGLKAYRNWVYSHIASDKVAEKRQRYFSPEEIDVIEQRLREQPEILTYWRKHVPLSLDDVRKSPR
jgi:hypothetical protein